MLGFTGINTLSEPRISENKTLQFSHFFKTTVGWEYGVADPDPGSGAFLTPGSGMEQFQIWDPGSGKKHHGSYFREA